MVEFWFLLWFCYRLFINSIRLFTIGVELLLSDRELILSLSQN
jgi:hypothetical protein